VGGINTLFGYGLFALLITLGVHYTIAVLIGTILGVLFNFKTTGALVFKNKNNKLLFKFFAVYSVNYVIYVGGIKLLSRCISDSRISGAIVLPVAVIVMYFLQKKYVFKSTEAGK